MKFLDVSEYLVTTLVLFLIPISLPQAGFVIDGLFVILYFLVFAPLLPLLISMYLKSRGRYLTKKVTFLFVFINVIGAVVYIAWILAGLQPGF